MLIRRQLVAAVLAASTLGGSLCLGVAAPAAAAGNEKAWRIGTYVGSAATIYALARGKGTLALIGGGATLLSYTQWKKAAQRRRERDTSLGRYRSYRTSWLTRNRGKRVRHVR